jgi:membrane protease YdiL (CAAX protease family)
LPIWLAYPAVGVAALFLAVLTFGEEYGCRGYLLPKLLPLGEVKAAVIVGLIWGLWHAPLLLAGLNFADVNPSSEGTSTKQQRLGERERRDSNPRPPA